MPLNPSQLNTLTSTPCPPTPTPTTHYPPQVVSKVNVHAVFLDPITRNSVGYVEGGAVEYCCTDELEASDLCGKGVKVRLLAQREGAAWGRGKLCLRDWVPST